MLIKHLMKHASCSDTPLQTHKVDLSYPLSVLTATCCRRSLHDTMQFFIIVQKRHMWTTVIKYICRQLPVKTQPYYSTIKTLSVQSHSLVERSKKISLHIWSISKIKGAMRLKNHKLVKFVQLCHLRKIFLVPLQS